MINDNDNEFDEILARVEHALMIGADKAAQGVVEQLRLVPAEVIESVRIAVRDAVDDIRDCSYELIEDA